MPSKHKRILNNSKEQHQVPKLIIKLPTKTQTFMSEPTNIQPKMDIVSEEEEVIPRKVLKKFQPQQYSFEQLMDNIEPSKWIMKQHKTIQTTAQLELCEKYEFLCIVGRKFHCRYCYTLLDEDAEKIDFHMHTMDHKKRKEVARKCSLDRENGTDKEKINKKDTTFRKLHNRRISNSSISSDSSWLKDQGRNFSVATSDIMLNPANPSELYIFDQSSVKDDMFANIVPKRLGSELLTMNESINCSTTSIFKNNEEAVLSSDVGENFDLIEQGISKNNEDAVLSSDVGENFDLIEQDLENEIIETSKIKAMEQGIKQIKANIAIKKREAELKRKFKEYKELKKQ